MNFDDLETCGGQEVSRTDGLKHDMHDMRDHNCDYRRLPRAISTDSIVSQFTCASEKKQGRG